MSQPEEEFLQRLRATFIVEADEHVQAMSSGMLELESTPPTKSTAVAIEAIFRHAHSLKGAARATNATEIESICQALETVFAEWKRERISLASENFDTLHRAIDLIGKLVPQTGARPSREDGQKITVLLRQLVQLAAPASTATPWAARPDGETSHVVAVSPVSFPPPDPPPPVTPAAPAVAARAQGDTIRISTAKLDRLLLNAEEMLVLKQNAAQRAADVRSFEALMAQWTTHWSRIQPQFRELRSSGGGLSAAASGALAEFLDWNFGYIKVLDGKLRALAKATALDRYAATKRVDDLLEESKQLVMLPFSTVADFFPKLVRDLGRDQGKEVTLIVRGGEVEMDKRILEEIKDALIHLVRNAVDHGIETPDRRSAHGKPARATLTLSAATIDGTKVQIVVSDDGGGIDLDRVKQSAIKRGIITVAAAPTLDARKTLDLIFQSDVSTSPIITEISGRGLGLAIVREKTEKLGGQVTVNTDPTGTTFRLTVPVTLATFRGILVKSAGAIFVLPTAHVERVARVKASSARTVENRETISLDDRAISLARLEDILELPPQPGNPAAPDFISVVLLGFGDKQIAFVVDEVLHEEEVLVKSLKRPLSRVRNIAGATVLASGRLALILNSADLLKSARKVGGARRVPQAATAVVPKAEQKSILMAEDSITSRMLLKGILESAGYKVKTAVDGLEAWTMLRSEDFDLVVSDVEMPRMNGFDLTAHIRADKKLTDKPVVLVTALASQEDRERGIDVGANAYIVKSSFDQSNLLDVVRRLA